ncbi:MAG: hypothetical protein HOZ81_38210 [Streptomyces sp.]|nr:hypothetical protein [Streptomyces sp.]NUP36316.1 hypothetical protein [Streptomyces sp.]
MFTFGDGVAVGDAVDPVDATGVGVTVSVAVGVGDGVGVAVSGCAPTVVAAEQPAVRRRATAAAMR